jgi:hypothetical protein
MDFLIAKTVFIFRAITKDSKSGSLYNLKSNDERTYLKWYSAFLTKSATTT